MELEDLHAAGVEHHDDNGHERLVSVDRDESGSECVTVSIPTRCIQECVEYVCVVDGSQAAWVPGGSGLVRTVRVDFQHVVVTMSDDNHLGVFMFVSVV